MQITRETRWIVYLAVYLLFLLVLLFSTSSDLSQIPPIPVYGCLLSKTKSCGSHHCPNQGHKFQPPGQSSSTVIGIYSQTQGSPAFSFSFCCLGHRIIPHSSHCCPKFPRRPQETRCCVYQVGETGEAISWCHISYAHRVKSAESRCRSWFAYGCVNEMSHLILIVRRCWKTM